MDRYIELTTVKALVADTDAAKRLTDYVEAEAKRAHSESDVNRLAWELGFLQGTVRVLVDKIRALHGELKRSVVDGACNGYVDQNKARLLETYGIDIEAEHRALEAGEEPEDEPDDDEAEVIADLNREFVADQMAGLRRVA